MLFRENRPVYMQPSGPNSSPDPEQQGPVENSETAATPRTLEDQIAKLKDLEEKYEKIEIRFQTPVVRGLLTSFLYQIQIIESVISVRPDALDDILETVTQLEGHISTIRTTPNQAAEALPGDLSTVPAKLAEAQQLLLTLGYNPAYHDRLVAAHKDLIAEIDQTLKKYEGKKMPTFLALHLCKESYDLQNEVNRFLTDLQTEQASKNTTKQKKKKKRPRILLPKRLKRKPKKPEPDEIPSEPDRKRTGHKPEPEEDPSEPDRKRTGRKTEPDEAPPESDRRRDTERRKDTERGKEPTTPDRKRTGRKPEPDEAPPESDRRRESAYDREPGDADMEVPTDPHGDSAPPEVAPAQEPESPEAKLDLEKSFLDYNREGVSVGTSAVGLGDFEMDFSTDITSFDGSMTENYDVHVEVKIIPGQGYQIFVENCKDPIANADAGVYTQNPGNFTYPGILQTPEDIYQGAKSVAQRQVKSYWRDKKREES